MYIKTKMPPQKMAKKICFQVFTKYDKFVKLNVEHVDLCRGTDVEIGGCNEGYRFSFAHTARDR